MEIKDLKDIKDFYCDIEDKIKVNLEALFKSVYCTYGIISVENKDLIKLEGNSERSFNVRYSKYIINFTKDNNIALAKSDISLLENKSISYMTIFSDELYQQYYCGCINIYYYDISNSNNNRTFNYLGRIYVNSCNQVAFKSDNHYVNFKKYEDIKDGLKSILLSIVGSVYNAQPQFIKPENMYGIEYEDLANTSIKKDVIEV